MWVATVDLMKAFDSITQVFLEGIRALRNRATIHQSLEKAKTEQKAAVFTDRESDVRDNEENVAGRPIVQFALRYSTPSRTERRRDTLAKERRHGHMLW